MLTKLRLLLQTVRYLRLIQIYYQVYYKLRNKLIRPHGFASLKGYSPVGSTLKFQEEAFDYVPDATYAKLDKHQNLNFTFLNVSHTLAAKNIDWNFSQEGKLWTYNLNYFDFLFLDSLSFEQKRACIIQYCGQSTRLRDGLEPYPISLRGINWVKFLAQNELLNDDINKVLYQHYQVLMANVEYHIMANHLIENGFSLLFGAYHFQNEAFYKKAKSILIKELEEQVLSDGAHFERSPMYHQIMLHRMLDCINLVSHNTWKRKELLDVLTTKAEQMLFWINEVSFSNGDIPMVQDSAFGIAPSTQWLNQYADNLNIAPSKHVKKLLASGYRKLQIGELELFLDVGSIGPSYQPGHAHAGETSFILYAQGAPVIVDVGVSTYEKNDKRQMERSTISHNCVSINDKNSSDVWGGFRLARRAQVKLLNDTPTYIYLQHDGYHKSGVTVSRICQVHSNSIQLVDTVEGANENIIAELRLHIHPSISPLITEHQIILEGVCINIQGVHEVEEESYMFANGFNKSVEASLIRLKLKSESKLLIQNAD